VPYANNARTHTPERVKQIAASERRAARTARGRGPLRLALGREKTDHGNKAAKPAKPIRKAFLTRDNQ